MLQNPSSPARASLPLRAPALPSSPWQAVYALGHRLRRRWFHDRAGRLPRPVISIGNLSWGGSGKTPVTAAIAAYLRDQGSRVAILSRGYGRQDKEVRVVSRGDGPLMGPRLAGDEPVLLAGLLPGVAVVVGADRYRAGRHALERLEPQPSLFLLDDGFSHLGLARDLDLLVFPAADPFAGGRLPPSGRLREPLVAATYADAVLLTGFDLPEEGGQQLARALRPAGFGGPGFTCRTEVGEPRQLPDASRPCGKRALVVSAIARPDEFLHTVRRLGFEIADQLSFPDHHRYPSASLEKIRQAFRKSVADCVLTTSKDRVKLQGRLDEPLVEIPVHTQPDGAFFRWLDSRLKEIGGMT